MVGGGRTRRRGSGSSFSLEGVKCVSGGGPVAAAVTGGFLSRGREDLPKSVGVVIKARHTRYQHDMSPDNIHS